MKAYVLAHAMLLVGATGALALAGGRLAARTAPGGVERLLGAAVLAAAFAVAEALALGLVGLGGSAWALAGAAGLTWVVARATTAPPDATLLDLLWRALPARGLAVLGGGALVGGTLGAAAVVLHRPGLGYDSLVYHLPEALNWVRSGHPGSVQFVLWNLPIGSYPLTSEVGLSWLLALGRSFAPVAPLGAGLVGLSALALGAAARWLGAPLAAAVGAAAAVVALPLMSTELASFTAGSDLPALAAVLCALALVARADLHPRLLAPALVALGLGIGAKTTVAPLAVGVAVLGVLRARASRVEAPVGARALVPAAMLALVVGAPWYVRTTIDHGWPLWPLMRGPTGDPLPPVLRPVTGSLLEDPVRTLRGHLGEYDSFLGGGTLLLGAAPLLALMARRRRALVGAAAVVLGVLAWTVAPVTGRSESPSLGYLAVGTLRYLLPTLTLGALAVALAAATPRLRWLVGLVLAGAIAWSASDVVALPEEFGHLPTGLILLAALAGTAAAALAGGVARGFPRPPRRVALAVGAVAAVGAIVVGSSGWVARHSRSAVAWDAGGAAWLAAQPAFHERRGEVAMAPFPAAALAGEHLQHPVRTIPPGEACPAVRARLTRGWVVLSSPQPSRLVACLRGIPPGFVDDNLAVWSPRA